MKFDFKTGLIAGLSLLLVASVSWSRCTEDKLRREKTQLINKLAESQKTIEIQNGLFVKLTQDADNLKSLLDNANNQVHALTEQLEKRNEEIVVLNKVAVKWKKLYEAAVEANQTPDETNPPVSKDCEEECSKQRLRVNFTGDVGPFRVNGYTVTNPPEAKIGIQQMKPLVLTLAVTQSEDGKWKTYVVSSDEDVEVDVQISAIDTSHFEPKWYEKIGVVGNIAVGDEMFSNVGLTYDLGSFSLGPTYGYSTSGASYVGMTLTWRPFKK